MTTRSSRLARSAMAGLLTVPLAVGLAAGADAAPKGKRSGGGTTTTATQILDISCSGLTFTVSSRSTVDVEVRWRVASSTILSFGSTYAVYTFRGVAPGEVRSAPAPSSYTVTSASVVPIAKSGRTSGTADSAAIFCPAG